MEGMTLRFHDDGTFRVLQMADIQDGPEVNRDTIRMIEAAINEAKPDLVVFTGDQIRGYDPAYIDTFLRRRGENPGARVRLVTEIEAKLHGIHRRIAARRDPDLPPQDDVVTMDDLMNDTRTLPRLRRRKPLPCWPTTRCWKRRSTHCWNSRCSRCSRKAGA